ncbi:P-loop NTPase fold protein [Paenibacillus sp. RC67]|uniref:P-loop NTPase fold protein n=1 Tax=Paenibacillus sp. RC67 TaxID=3039392 RepID=UPI0024AD83CF|nr:P-loop NTPase fold protein [Paenibacillus sp. RC67]
MPQKKCKTLFLEDVPTVSNDFAAHNRLSKTIINVIQTEEVSKTIALTGQWGSGKSSIISIMRKETDSNIKFVEFDAWEHEGNLLRRSFLETLLDSLEYGKWIKGEDWKETRTRLSKKLKVTDTKSIPVITREGKHFIMASALSVVGLLGINKISYPTQNTSGVLTWQTIPQIAAPIQMWGGVLLALMAISPVLVLFYYLFTKKSSNILSVFLNKTESVTQVETAESPEPSSIEFQTDFNNIIKDALSKYKNRKLVIVIDNLDRLSEDDILKTWSTMRTFLSFPEKLENELQWKKRLWIVLPIDIKAIENKLKKNDDNPSHKSLANSLIEKTVQIRFDVPPPALSKWKQYMLDLLNRVFPEHLNQDDFYKVYRVFLLYYIKKRQDDLITPRAIKLYINQIASAHAIWGDEIPLQDQAFYASMKLLNEDIYSNLINMDSDLNQYNDLLTENHYANIASMFLNVQEEEAIQIILGPKITIALSNGDINNINELSEKPGFFEVLEKIIVEDRPNYESSDNSLLLTSYCLSYIKVKDDGQLKSLNHVWDILLKASAKINSWSILEKLHGKGYLELLRRHPDRKKLLVNINKLNDAENDLANIWLSTIQGITQYLKENEYYDELKSIPAPVSNQMFLDFSAALKKEYIDLLPVISHNVDMQEVEEELIRRINQNSYNDTEISAIKHLTESGQIIGSEEVFTIINNRMINLDSTSDLGMNELNKLTNLLLQLFKMHHYNEDIRSQVNTMYSQGYILQHFYYSWNNSVHYHISGILICSYYILGKLFTNSYPGYSATGEGYLKSFLSSPNSYRDILVALVNSYKQYGDVNYLINNLTEDGELGLLSKIILEEIIKNSTDNFYIEKLVYFNKFKIIYNLFPTESIKMAEKYTEDNNFVELLLTDELKEELVPLYLKVLTEFPVTQREKLLEWIFDKLSEWNKETWKEHFSERGNIYELSQNLVKLPDNRYTLGVDYADMYVDMIIENGYKENFIMQGELLNFFTIIHSNYKSSVTQKLRQLITYSDNPVLIILHELSSELFSDKVMLTEEYINQLVNNGFYKIVERKDASEIHGITKVLKLRPDILKACERDFWNTFIDRLTKRQEELEEESPLYKALSELINLSNNISKSLKLQGAAGTN